jgi:hypothetical protein
VIGATVGGTSIVAGAALAIYDLFTEHHSITTHGDDDDEAWFTAPTRGGAVVGYSGRF